MFRHTSSHARRLHLRCVEIRTPGALNLFKTFLQFYTHCISRKVPKLVDIGHTGRLVCVLYYNFITTTIFRGQWNFKVIHHLFVSCL